VDESLLVAGRLQVRDATSKPGNEPGELGPVRAELGAKHRRRCRRDVPTERLDERLVGDQHLLVTAAEEHRSPLITYGTAELADEPRLADPGLTGDDREPTGPAAGLRPLAAEPVEGVVAAEERAAQWPPQRRGKRWRIDGRGGSRSVPVDVVQQPPRLPRGRHPQLRSKAPSEHIERHASGGQLPRGDEAPDQLALCVLAKRIQLDAAAR